MFDYVKKVFSSFIGRKNTEINREPRVIGPREHGINPKMVSFAARKTCENLQARGFKAYIVGGAVRDLLLGVTPKDFDVATDATPEQVKRAQRRAYIIGKRFRLVHVVFGQEIIECSTFRALDAAGQRKDASGRVISDNVFGQMWEDAARRDFTINGLYYDPSSGEVFDYHNGFEDLKRKRLAMIGAPEARYREDPVRMMRAVRIATKLGFKIESATERAIPKMAKNLENVPAARLFDEMMKLFTCGHAESCLIKLRQEGLHRALLPMLDVILKEKEGEDFLMLALRRTDERIASGKKISPAFLFATLLWPQVLKRWEAYQTRPKMIRSKALYAAADDVVATQCAKLAIQNRFVADMKLIWMLQLRFERRTGKNPYSLVEHVKYRAGYDFMLLRSLLGQVATEDVRWWEDFVAAGADKRKAMIAQEEQKARKTGDKARAGNARRQEERFVSDTVERLTEEQMPARLRQAQKNEKRRAGKAKANSEKNRLVPVKEQTPQIAISPSEALTPVTDTAPSRFEEVKEVALDAQESLIQVETKKPAVKSRRPKKATTVKQAQREQVDSLEPHALSTTPSVSEGLIQIETNPVYAMTEGVVESRAAEPVSKAPTKARGRKKAQAQSSQTETTGNDVSPDASFEAPKKRTRRAAVKTVEGKAPEVVKPTESVGESVEVAPQAKPKKRVTRKAKATEVNAADQAQAPASAQTPSLAPGEEDKPKAKPKRVRKTAPKNEVKSADAVVQESGHSVSSEEPTKKPRRAKKVSGAESASESAAEVKPQRRTRTVKKVAQAPQTPQADAPQTSDEPVSLTARRKSAPKKSALTHTVAEES